MNRSRSAGRAQRKKPSEALTARQARRSPPLPVLPQLTTPLPQLPSPQILRAGNSSTEAESLGSQQENAALKQLTQAQTGSSPFGSESEGEESSSSGGGSSRAMQIMQGTAQSQGRPASTRRPWRRVRQ